MIPFFLWEKKGQVEEERERKRWFFFLILEGIEGEEEEIEGRRKDFNL